MPVFGCQKRKNNIGILIAQLGTPNSPTAKDLRPYLKEFLGDRRVIEKPRLLWWFILNFIILLVRPKRSAALYQRIWMEEGSPLLVYTEKLTEKLREKVNAQHKNIHVAFGMRYGSHSIKSAIKDLIDKDCRRIVIFNMYPQYSGTTVASNYDAIYQALLNNRWVPTLKVVEPYYNHPRYLEAVVERINEGYSKIEEKPDKLIISYHGIPLEYVDKGDPYCCMCLETTRALKDRLDVNPDDIIHTFQSQFGKDPWLEPYFDQKVKALPKEGVKSLAVFSPGFTTDCLETLDELGNEGEEDFLGAGGEAFHLIPCLNDSPAWIDAMYDIIKEEIDPWLRDHCEETCVTCPARG